MYSAWLKSSLVVGAVLLGAGQVALGQFQYFNVLQFPGNNNASVLENDTGYVLLQQGNPQANYFFQHHYNKTGQFLKRDSITMPAFYEDSPQSLVDYKGGYLKLATLLYSLDSAEVSLIHLSKSLDTLKTISYSYQDLVISEGFGLHYIRDNLILILGRHTGRFNGYRKALALALDSNFQPLWDTIYAPANQNEPGGYAFYDAVLMGDGGFLFSGLNGFYFSNSNSKPKGLLLKTDSLGQEEWRLELSGPEGNNEVLLQKLSDSTVAFVTARIDSPDTQPFTRLRMGIVNSNGIITKDTAFGSLTRNMQIQFFESTKDGNFIAGGYAQGLGFKSYAIKFKSNGEIIWFREYFFGNEIGIDIGELASLIFTQDGGLLFAGSFFDADGLGTHQWLVKTDSFGCLVPGCQNIGLREASAGKPTNFKVYPNPAWARVTVTWSWFEAGLTAPLEFKILSPQGQLLNNYRVENYQNNQQVLNLEALATGTYLLEISSNEKVLDVQRLVKK
jgi:hypothetical protein